MANDNFDAKLNSNEAIAWDNVKAVIHGLLGKHRADDYPVLVQEMLASFETIGVHMSLKIHFLNSHLNIFERQMPSESDEHGEKFHQDIMDMEKRYKGKKLDHMLADFCWYICQADSFES